MATRPNAPAVERNKNAILDVIRDEFKDCGSILEIGSGTGQHAIFFAGHMPWLTWQTSDLPANHDGISAWLQYANLDNVKAPIVLGRRGRSFVAMNVTISTCGWQKITAAVLSRYAILSCRHPMVPG